MKKKNNALLKTKEQKDKSRFSGTSIIPASPSDKKCECCGNILEISFAGTLFCNSCAVYHAGLKRELYSLRGKIKRLEKKKYGLK